MAEATAITLPCSRCTVPQRAWTGPGVSGGCYDLSDPLYRRYGRPGERHLCSPCMNADALYQADFRGLR